ncbi:TetR/AcrR family transcriptional regulator [Trujillonella humicola]|uniref:TetR/AcrR family transcriptional regulator n=1 Tax=Trujillonella humicola TaxID=3383699 RepID=UPI003906C07D
MSADAEGPPQLGPRAARTRDAILAAARNLFLRSGYAGTTVADITEACAISRAGFYSYFRDKREVFTHLGRSVHAECLTVVDGWSGLPAPAPPEAVAGWVHRYFSFLDRHGAFVLAGAVAGPADAEFREASRRSQLQVARRLGRRLQARQPGAPAETPAVLGLAVIALVERSWLHARTPALGVDEGDMVQAVTVLITGVLGAGPPTDGAVPGGTP